VCKEQDTSVLLENGKTNFLLRLPALPGTHPECETACPEGVVAAVHFTVKLAGGPEYSVRVEDPWKVEASDYAPDLCQAVTGKGTTCEVGALNSFNTYLTFTAYTTDPNAPARNLLFFSGASPFAACP
jgi:hypothetical protein